MINKRIDKEKERTRCPIDAKCFWPKLFAMSRFVCYTWLHLMLHLDVRGKKKDMGEKKNKVGIV